MREKGIPGGANSLSKNTGTSKYRRNSRNGVYWFCLTRPGLNLVEHQKAKFDLALS